MFLWEYYSENEPYFLRKAVEKIKNKEGDQSWETLINDMNEVHVHLEYGILQKRKSK